MAKFTVTFQRLFLEIIQSNIHGFLESTLKHLGTDIKPPRIYPDYDMVSHIGIGTK
jgi:hypothetical protein